MDTLFVCDDVQCQSAYNRVEVIVKGATLDGYVNIDMLLAEYSVESFLMAIDDGDIMRYLENKGYHIIED
ncbi:MULTISPECIES: hypothetical protein [Morganellaceae]|uniref:hypothetical protein n=1 Tax=Morganellaceae TaxID=1903414 RepID=UPI0034E5A038